MTNIRIACAAITKRIYAGRISRDGTDFIGKKIDVTSDVIKAVIDRIGIDNTDVVSVNGEPKFEILVRGIAQKTVAQSTDIESLRAALNVAARWCHEAYTLTGDDTWLRRAELCREAVKS